MKSWYVIHCRPQQDARAEMELRNQAYEVFRPLVRFQRHSGSRLYHITESMFPRYLFICLDNLVNWSPIRSTRGVVGLLRWGSYAPSVPKSVIEDLQRRVDLNNCINLPADDYQQYEPIRIIEGPFAGYEGIFDVRSGVSRVVVLLEIMQRVQRLEVPEYAIEHA